LENEWQVIPGFPFTIACFTEYEKKIFPGNSLYHILYLEKGRIFCKRSAGFIIYKQTGFMIIPPLQGPGVRLAEGNQGYVMITGPLLFEDITAKLLDRQLFSLPEKEVSYFPVNEQERDVFSLIMDNMNREWNEQKPGFKEVIRLKLTELFIHLARSADIVTRPLGPGGPAGLDHRETGQRMNIDIRTGSKKIAEICAYLETMYHLPLSLEEIAEETGFSTSYLSRYFKNQTGICLFEYINRLRIKRACFLLKNTDKKIIEIAYESGYNNVSFFNRYFKKTLYLSPMEYRKKVQT
jgi:AraC-like DNA-binding protein